MTIVFLKLWLSALIERRKKAPLRLFLTLSSSRPLPCQ
jgi:hypothetical protein